MVQLREAETYREEMRQVHTRLGLILCQPAPTFLSRSLFVCVNTISSEEVDLVGRIYLSSCVCVCLTALGTKWAHNVILMML